MKPRAPLGRCAFRVASISMNPPPVPPCSCRKIPQIPQNPCQGPWGSFYKHVADVRVLFFFIMILFEKAPTRSPDLLHHLPRGAGLGRKNLARPLLGIQQFDAKNRVFSLFF